MHRCSSLHHLHEPQLKLSISMFPLSTWRRPHSYTTSAPVPANAEAEDVIDARRPLPIFKIYGHICPTHSKGSTLTQDGELLHDFVCCVFVINAKRGSRRSLEFRNQRQQERSICSSTRASACTVRRTTELGQQLRVHRSRKQLTYRVGLVGLALIVGRL